MKDRVAVVFSAAFSLDKISHLQSAVKNTIEENNIKHREIFVDGHFIVAEVDDPVTVAPILTDLFSIDKVTIMDQASNKFNDIVAAIVNVGK